ncbi:hypothetical protein IKI14_04375 [bacterium]|nr:hypothetical protein [bacterium]
MSGWGFLYISLKKSSTASGPLPFKKEDNILHHYIISDIEYVARYCI